MSSTSLAVSVVSASDSKEPGCEPSHSARLSHSLEPSSPSTGQTSPAMTMCAPSPPPDLRQTELFPMSSAVDFRAKTLAWQEAAPELTDTVAGYGESTPDLLANFDPATSSWRTSQHSLEGGLAEYLETWPRSGLMRSGTAYRLPTLVPDNFGIEFGLWPTPNATAFKGGRSSPRRGKANPERNNWQDWCSLVLGQRYPVPETAEQVMGFPTGHTEISPSETPLSRKSQNSSVKP